MRWLAWFLPLLLPTACVTYPTDYHPAACHTDADCNPVRTCGELVRCIAGACDPAHTMIVPCDQRCSIDDDCVLADKGCCCGPDAEDYVAILRDDLSDWLNRPACKDVQCPLLECMAPEGIRATCKDRRCVVQVDEELWYACEVDEDCAKVPTYCPGCDCHAGYEEAAVNRGFREEYLAKLDEICATVSACETGPYGVYACTNRPAACQHGRCRVLGEDCGCPLNWNPVCARVDEVRVSFPNACQTECLGLSWFYHGLCACETACLDPEPVCATNNVTYWCGPEEAVCSRLPVGYPGDCIPECEHCADIDREPIPVCAEDLRNYYDVCYAECHGLRWWHEGDCLAGEGVACDDGYDAVPCPSDDLHCLVDEFCPDCPGCPCPGTCIAQGHCMWRADCSNQDIPHDDCGGRWVCREHTCEWRCS